jgi:hypothetical protein
MTEKTKETQMEGNPGTVELTQKADAAVTDREPLMTAYAVTDKDQTMLGTNFVYHAPKADQPKRYVILRDTAKGMAELIIRLCPPSRERSVALTHLETAIFWANAAIARNE